MTDARASSALACACAALAAASAGAPARAVAAARGAAAPVRIALRPSAEVPGPEVTLGEVAVLTTRDLPTLRRLMELPVARGPLGGIVRLERDRLAPFVRARAGLDIEWAGAATSDVRLGGREISGEAIASAAEAALRAALERGGDRVQLEERQTPRAIAAPAGRVALRARPPGPGTVTSRRVSVWVDVWVDDRLVRSVPVRFALGPAASGGGGSGRAEVARRAGARPPDATGAPEAATDADPDPERLPPAPAASAAAPVTGAPSGDSAGTGAGAPPERRPELPLVARGTWAVLRAGQGAVVLESRAEVLDDGRAGETVRVKLPGGSSTILARVTGPGTLEVLP